VEFAADHGKQRGLQVVDRRKLAADDQTGSQSFCHRACLGKPSAGPAPNADHTQQRCQLLGQGVASLLGDPQHTHVGPPLQGVGERVMVALHRGHHGHVLAEQVRYRHVSFLPRRQQEAQQRIRAEQATGDWRRSTPCAAASSA
jgi:hypothetical protein